MFHGSYNENDVTFLLKKIDIKETDIKNKELLIQSGKKHYSQMLSYENPPSLEYLNVFYESLELNKDKFAKDLLYMANIINKIKNPVIVSLARAGTPIGVLIKRIISELFDNDIQHYCISIIRDKGLDLNALDFIIKKHPDSEIVFLDGWTGKGVISRELKKSVKSFNNQNNTFISDKLYVLSDISGSADISATNNDYLIPSAVLNSTISGLISRTVTDIDSLKNDDFHGCKFYTHLKEYDLSNWFIDYMMNVIKETKNSTINNTFIKNESNNELRKKSVEFIDFIMKKYDIKNINHIKPGIGETTRVLLRRVPERILVKNIESDQIKHLKILAKEKNCPIDVMADMPYNAVGLIAKIKD